MTWTATPREDHPSRIETDAEAHERGPVPRLSPTERAELVAAFERLQATADGRSP